MKGLLYEVEEAQVLTPNCSPSVTGCGGVLTTRRCTARYGAPGRKCCQTTPYHMDSAAAIPEKIVINLISFFFMWQDR